MSRLFIKSAVDLPYLKTSLNFIRRHFSHLFAQPHHQQIIITDVGRLQPCQ
jgi:hypothetical protein